MGMENAYDIAEKVEKQLKRDQEKFDEGYRVGYREGYNKAKDERKLMKEEKGDLISRNALREEVKTLFCPGGYKRMMLDCIDNAPTVKPCENCDLYFKAMTKEIDRWYKKEDQKGGVE